MDFEHTNWDRAAEESLTHTRLITARADDPITEHDHLMQRLANAYDAGLITADEYQSARHAAKVALIAIHN